VETHRKVAVALYADRAGRQWIARDNDGQFWVLPPGDNSWEKRQPFDPTREADLEPLPGHYGYMLGISP
jgi:hypothetical protein